MAGIFSGRSLFGFIVIPASLAFIAFTIIVFAVSCGRGAPESASGSPGAIADSVAENSAGQFDDSNQEFSSVKRELIAAEVPSGVDGEVWEALKAAFLIELERADGVGTAVDGARGLARKTSAAPKDDAGMVTDLAYEGAVGTLTWSYVNRGDYDLSGDVGIPDITAIALNFGKTAEYLTGGAPAGDIGTPQGKENHQRAWIDGDNSGEIGVSDVTPIALNYLADVAGYAIMTSDTAAAEDGAWEEIDRVPLGGTGSFPIQFYYSLPSGAKKFVAVRPYSAGGGTGALSNLVSVTASVAPVIYAVNKPEGVSGEVKIVSAAVSGTQPMSYEWSFGGGTTPNTSDNPMPTVQLKSVGWYNGRLTVRNAEGESFFDFQYYVSVQPLGEPVPVLQTWPASGNAPLEVTFICRSSFSPNGEIKLYEWDFESDGIVDFESTTPVNVNHVYEAGSWSATLRITDEAMRIAEAVSEVIYSFPIDTWHIEALDFPNLKPYSSLALVAAFEHPATKQPSFAYNALSGGTRLGIGYYADGEWGFYAESPVELGTKACGFVLPMYNGNVAFFENPGEGTPYDYFIAVKNQTQWQAATIPDIPEYLGSYVSQAYCLDIYDNFWSLFYTIGTGDTRATYVVDNSEQQWTHTLLNTPNPFVRHIAYTTQGISVVTGVDSVFLGVKKPLGWEYEIVDIATPTFSLEPKIAVLNGQAYILAQKINFDAANRDWGIVLYSKKTGYWDKETVFGDDEGSNWYDKWSFTTRGNKICVAASNVSRKLLRIAFYTGKDWIREAIQLPPTVSYFDSVKLCFDADFRLYVFWRLEDSDGSWFYFAMREPFE